MEMDKSGLPHRGESDFGRRSFLRAGSLGLLGISLRQFFHLESQLAAA